MSVLYGVYNMSILYGEYGVSYKTKMCPIEKLLQMIIF